MRDKGKFNKIGMTIFWVAAGAILFFFAIFRLSDIVAFFKNMFHIMSPVIIGAVIAYLINPFERFIHDGVMKITGRMFKMKLKTRGVISNTISIIVSLGAFIAALAILIRIVIPEVYASILLLSSNMKGYGNAIYDWANSLFQDDPEMHEQVQEIIEIGVNYFYDWFNNDFLAYVQQVLGPLVNGVAGFVKFIINFVIGLCVAVYLILSRERLIGQSKKFLYSMFSKERTNMYLAITRQIDSIFGGFIIGKILDSIVVGVLCFIGVSILKMPYVALISVVIGVTNIIPMFGPFIGAIPCAFLILISDPMKCLIFIIFILVLQQIDGNIIGPLLLGESTGLSAFWVVVALTIGGGLFGFFGMILGVPTFAVIYFLIKTFVELKLKEKNLPMTTLSYTRIKRIDPETNRAEFLNSSMSKQDIKKNKVNEEEVSKEIAIVAERERRKRENRNAEASSEDN